MDDFAERLAAATPTPGGGAAAARVGLFATSLLRMVTGITLAKLPPAEASAEKTTPASSGQSTAALAIERAVESGRRLGQTFQQLEVEDMAAFQAYLDALRLPRSTPEEKERRLAARRSAASRATEAPLATMTAARDTLRLCAEVLELSRTTPLRAESDLGAAVELTHAAFRVAELNVNANLPELSEDDRQKALTRWHQLEEEVQGLYTGLRSTFTTKA